MPAPKIFRIFRPRKGKPLSLRGMAAMLSSSAKAWHTLDCLGGYVDWSHGRPTIVPNGSGGEFGASSRLPFDIRVNQTTSKIEVYVTSDGVSATDMAYLNGQELECQDAAIQALVETGWYELADLPADTVTTTVYFRLEPYTSLAVDADLTSQTAMRWVVSTSAAAATHGTFKQRVIATVNNTGGVFTVTQFLRGSQSVNARYTDTESVAKLGANDFHDTQSIDTQSADGNGNQSLTLFGIKAGTTITDPDVAITEAEFRFIIRRKVGLLTKVMYLSYAYFKSIIETIIGDNPTPPPPPPDYGDIPGAPDVDEPWPTDGDHGGLSDISTQTVVDDHRGGRTAAAGISQSFGGGTVTGHPLIHANGNETRNSMPEGAYIGDGANKKSIYPHLRQLFAEIGGVTTVVVDWIARQLSGGFWTVTDTTEATGTAGSTTGALIVDGGVNIKDNVIIQDTTAAGAGAGALVVDGGVYAGQGVYADKGTADYAGRFNGSGDVIATLGATTTAGSFINTNSSTFVELCGGTYAVNALEGLINSTDGFAFNGTNGVSGDGFSGGIKTDAAAASASTEDKAINATMFGGLL